jgi:hypothetical protein
MKKIFLLGLMGLMGIMGAQAQFGNYGVKVGIGMATVDDDLSSKSPILGASVGGYINYTFAQSESVLAETFFLQTGLNLTRRGGNFQEVLENGASLMFREGYYHSYYLQLPILACVHYELPIRSAGHVVGVFVGPAISFGLFGAYGDRRVTPGVASHSANYDVQVNGSDEDRQVFNHINRFDVDLILGLSYEHGPYTLSLYIDRGFLATSEGDDILRIIENSAPGSNKVDIKIPNGHNVAYMLSVSYSLGSFMKE